MPPAQLEAEVRSRIPDAVILHAREGELAVITAEDYGWSLRQRQDAAGAAVGWKGDIVGFPVIDKKCRPTFSRHCPPPPPVAEPIGPRLRRDTRVDSARA